jgi:hypothetical protein
MSRKSCLNVHCPRKLNRRRLVTQLLQPSRQQLVCSFPSLDTSSFFMVFGFFGDLLTVGGDFVDFRFNEVLRLYS